MKNLNDIINMCHDERQNTIERLLERLDELADDTLTNFEIGGLKGFIWAHEMMIEKLHATLKYHECDYHNDECVLCGEKR